MDIEPEWDDVLDRLPGGWRLGPMRFFPDLGEWQACAETIDGNGCVMGTGPDSERAMADLVHKLDAVAPTERAIRPPDARARQMT